MIETAHYRITGLVDIFDEQNNITGQFPIGSIQELPIETGDAAVSDGRAESVSDEEAAAAADTEVEAAPEEEVAAEGATGEGEGEDPTGETGEAPSGDDGDKEEEVL